MNEFTKGGGNRWGLAATDPTLNDRLDDLLRTGDRWRTASRHRVITTRTITTTGTGDGHGGARWKIATGDIVPRILYRSATQPGKTPAQIS
jgi:hypothetical protein